MTGGMIATIMRVKKKRNERTWKIIERSKYGDRLSCKKVMKLLSGQVKSIMDLIYIWRVKL